MDRSIKNISASSRDSFKPQQDSGGQGGRTLSDGNIYYIDTDPGPLKKKLKKGDKIKSRIVLLLDEERYLIRLYGYNFVMQSHLNFKRGEEALLTVHETEPKLKLQLTKNKPNRPKHGGTDITV